jgi:hypothetical protein
MAYKLEHFREFYRFSISNKTRSNSIGAKLLISVLTVSSIFVILQTLIQLNNDYNSGISDIDRRFNQLYLSYSGGLARSMWDINVS